MDGLAFITDRQGVITCIGTRKWDAFANENGAPELRAVGVIGRSLFEFIEGTDVQNQLKRAMQRASQDPDWSWILLYRCDAPELKRKMRQAMNPIFSKGACAGFIFQSVELHVQPRPPINLFDFKELQLRAAQRSDLPVVMMCSWCQKVQHEPVCGEQWVEAEDYYSAGGSSNVRLSHCICEQCLDAQLEYFEIE